MEKDQKLETEDNTKNKDNTIIDDESDNLNQKEEPTLEEKNLFHR